MRNLKKIYSKKVNPKYYETIKVKGTATEPHELTKEEFQQGKQGIVWADNKTGKLVFKDEEGEPLGLMELIRQEQLNKPPVSVEKEFEKMNIISRKPKVMTIYGGVEFIKKLRKILSKNISNKKSI